MGMKSMANQKKVNQKGSGYQTYEDRHDTIKELDWDNIEDLIYNAEQGRTDFPSYVLDASDYLDPSAGSQQGTFIYARLRPKYYDHQCKPSPCDFKDVEDQFICLSDHPIAFSETKAGDTRNIPLSPGDSVMSYWEQGPEYGGTMRRLRFYLDKVTRNNDGNYDFKCLKIKKRRARSKQGKINRRDRSMEALRARYNAIQCTYNKVPKDQAGEIADDAYKRALIGVISKNQTSKDYDHVKPIDGGSVGIAHWAGSGINKLLASHGSAMVQAAFGMSIGSVSGLNCRYGLGRTKNGKIKSGKKKTEAGQMGCYGLGWWRIGMKKLLSHPKSKEIQEQHWKKTKWDPATSWMASQPAAADKFYTERHYSIVSGISNTIGVGGMQKLARRANINFDPEKMLEAYIFEPMGYANQTDALKRSQVAHRLRRAEAIDKTFPCGGK